MEYIKRSAEFRDVELWQISLRMTEVETQLRQLIKT
jgi:hypothetical protein